MVGAFLESAAAAVVFLCSSAECEVDPSPFSSSLDFCPSGDLARPRRYLHATVGKV